MKNKGHAIRCSFITEERCILTVLGAFCLSPVPSLEGSIRGLEGLSIVLHGFNDMMGCL